MTTQTILVTGASRGLGAATARLVAEIGANVALMARSTDDLEAVADSILASGGQALTVAGDVSRAADCQRAIAETVERFGGLDGVVNNAGVLRPIAPIADGDPRAWERNLAVNVLGPFLITQAALPHLRQRGGRVINVSTGAAVRAVRGFGAYCAAKAALNHFTRVLAEEEPEVTAIAIAPGVVDTTMQQTIRQEGKNGMPAEVHASYVGYHERGELNPPEVPGCALAIAVCHAPHEWSGGFLAWDEPRVQSLVVQFGCSPGRLG
jgi:NAD(P)-dependent dehydrogenase (short-subunit alcohol dehydrogenase family)